MDAQNSMGIFCGAEDKDPQLPDIFTTLFLQQLASRNFSEALSALLQNPSELKQSACLRQLLITLLADGEKKTLVKLDYGSLTETVEDNLENICRGLRAEKAEGIYDLLYSFHFERFNFKKAARAMYEYASRLNKVIYSKTHLKKRSDALAVVVVSLKLMEEHEREEEVRREQIIADARLELFDLNQSSAPPVETQDILRELIKHQRYDSAMIIYCEFKLPPYDLLEEVAHQSIIMDRFASDTKEYQNFTAHNTRLLETIKGESRLHWRLIRSYVELSRKHWPYDAKILRTVAVVFLKHSLKIPAWLENHYKSVNCGDFLCSLIEFGELTEAFNHLLPELDEAIKKVSVGNSHDAILPYTHIDWLLVLAGKESVRCSESIDKVKQKLSKLWNLSETLRNN